MGLFRIVVSVGCGVKAASRPPHSKVTVTASPLSLELGRAKARPYNFRALTRGDERACKPGDGAGTILYLSRSRWSNRLSSMKKCPKCEVVNADTAERCDCGYDFVADRIEALR